MAKVRVRARTLDMLGRQQMASIPNALHELYKNAYDAYAKVARTDYYRSERLLILRDDGVGMTKSDFENRWLTLGTESKLAQGGIDPPYVDKTQSYRHPLGEKGIGRLAIATIGPQVFILSRAERDTGLQDMVLSFLNWTFFEIPGLDIDEIDVPVLSIEKGRLPTQNELLSLVEATLANLGNLRNKLPEDMHARLLSELNAAQDTVDTICEYLQAVALADAKGTVFVVALVDSVLEQDIDEETTDSAPPLLRNLRGFANTMMPNVARPPMIAEFWDHKRDGTAEDIISADSFFVPHEFLSADQHIEGTFDEYGQFVGKVVIYHQDPQKYLLPWTGGQGQRTRCGGFKIRFGYLQGVMKESLLERDEWENLAGKLNQYGGIYVYRNGIRVLPYGNSDFDWLNIELRRTKAAKDWVFSYRRVFGAIELSSTENSALVEKAGREGFRENLAYRQFRSILENLFKEVAKDWFREGTAKFGNYREQLSRLQAQAAILKKRADSLRGKQEKLKKELDTFFDRYERHLPQDAIEKGRLDMQTTLKALHGLPPDEAARELLALEGDLQARLQRLRIEYRVVTPRGVTLFKNVRKDLDRSTELFILLEKEYFYPFEQEINASITQAITEARALLSHRKRIRQALDMRGAAEEKRARNTVKEAKAGTDALQQEVIARSREGLSALDLAIKDALSSLEREDLSSMNEQEIEKFRKTLEISLELTAEAQLQDLERLNSQIQSTLEAIRTDAPLDEAAAALEERSHELEEELSRYTELAQVGAAIGILRHEFESTAEGLRNQLRQLTSKSSGNEELFSLSQNIRTNFEHLDTYLSMFTPFNRRLYRKPQQITGETIIAYLKQLFADRFERHAIKLELTPQFLAHSVIAYPSAFFPAFINIVDNGIYWLTRDAAGEKLPPGKPRIVSFSADAEGFLVSNNGPGIDERDANRIFEMSFTRKLRGRGMGLAVAKKALQEAGFNLQLVQAGRANQPTFRLTTTPVAS